MANRMEAEAAPRIVTLAPLLAERRKWSDQAKSVVWTNGCFDLFHLGHLHSLRSARALGDVLVVGVNSDASVRRLKGPGRPIVPAAERAEIVAALACVDRVIVFDDLTPEAILAQLKPDIHCKGGDYAPPGGKPIPEAALIHSYGGRIEFLPLVPLTSTTERIRRIEELLSGRQPGAAER
jgi:rfaE bifunctional protein nucleotidyltransferase chain/domain